MRSRLKDFTRKFWLLDGKITDSVSRVLVPAPVSIEDSLLASTAAGEDAIAAPGRPFFMAKKKKRKPPTPTGSSKTPAKKKAEPAPAKAPAKKKAAPAPAKPAKGAAKKKKAAPRFATGKSNKPRQASFASRADKFFSGWSDYITGEIKSGSDWARLSLLLTGLLVIIFFSFSAGGYFAVRRSYGELWVLYLLVLGLLFGWQLRGRMSRLGMIETGLFSAYSLWILLSVTWSLIPSASYTEFLRSILYLAGFGLFYLYLARREWLAWIGHLFVAIVVVVAFSSLWGKIFPDQRPFDFDARLSNPITYWNTMALFMIMGFPIGLRVLADRATNVIVRCYYGVALFLMAVVMYFTFSRASYPIFLLAVGVYVLVASSRLRAVMQAGITLLWTGLVVGVCYATLPGMLELSPTLDERVSQGHSLGIVIFIMLLFAIGSQVAVWRLEKTVEVTADLGRKVAYGMVAAGVVISLVLGGVYIAKKGNPVTQIVDQIQSSDAQRTAAASTAGERLFSVQSERFQEYKVSLDVFKANPMVGTGAATWQTSWLQDRPAFTDAAGQSSGIPVKNGHSIFFDSLAELGIIGAGLLVGFFALFITISVKDLRSLGKNRHRELYGAFFAASLALVLHAQFDWDWQMPVVFLSFFMFAGALLRFGMLSRAAAEAGGEEPDMTGGDAQQAWNIRRLLSWNWALGVLSIVAMIFIILFLFVQTRIAGAEDQANQINALVQQGTVTLNTKYAELGSTAESARAVDIFKLESEPLILQAIAAQGQGKLDNAEQLLLQAEGKEPNNYKIYLNLARLYVTQKNVDKAVEAVRHARQLNPLDTYNQQGQGDISAVEQQVRDIGGFLEYNYGPGGVLLPGSK